MWKLGISKVGVALAAVIVGVFSPPLHARSCHEYVEPARHLYSLGGRITNEPIRRLEQLTTLKVTTHNVLQLRLNEDEYSTDLGVKNARQIIALGQTHHRIDSDVLFLQELEGAGTPALFSKRYLGDAYEAVVNTHVHGFELSNAIFIKKNLFPHFRITRVRLPVLHWNDPARNGQRVPVFHREPVMATVYRKAKSPDEPPDFIFVNWHLKSQKNRHGDPKSAMLRTQQINGMMQIHRALKKKFPQTMIVHGGDFNGSLQEDPILQPLYRELTDVYHLSHSREAESDASISWDVNGQHRLNSERVDGFLVSNDQKQFIKQSEIVPLFSARGWPEELPKTPHELHMQASDHRPAVMLIDLERYYAR